MAPHSWKRTGRNSYICELGNGSLSMQYHEYYAKLVFMEYGKAGHEIHVTYDYDTQEISVLIRGTKGLEGIAAQVHGIGTEGLETKREKDLSASLLSMLLQD